MNGYTSGKTTRDPRPWVLKLNHIGTQLRQETQWVDVIERDETEVYDPRPEFDNHNPILSDLRENGDIAGHLEFCTDHHSAGHYSTPLGKAHIAHARRVLAKLAALHER